MNIITANKLVVNRKNIISKTRTTHSQTGTYYKHIGHKNNPMQKALTDKVNLIETKVKQLGAKLQTLQLAHDKLQKDYKELQSKLIQKNTKILALEKQTKVLPLAQQKNKIAQMKERKLKKEIAQYIKEIDNCIDWLKTAK